MSLCLAIHIPNLTGFIDFNPWLIGFIDAEGCFVCSIIKKRVRPQFIIGFHSTEKLLLDKIYQKLGYGVRYKRKNGVERFQLSSNKTMCAFARQFLLTNEGKSCLKTTKQARAKK